MNLKITYSQLKNELLKLGFVESRSVGSHTVLQHPKTDSSIVMPVFKSTKLAQQYFVMAVKKNVTGKGILTEAQFDELMLKYRQ